MGIKYVDGSVGSDSNAGTSPGAGNAWATLSKALSTLAQGDLCYVKASATYSISAGLTANAGAGSVSYQSRTRLVGYTTTPGDGGKATVQPTTGMTILAISGSGWGFENLTLDGNSVASVKGVSITGSYHNYLLNCKVMGCTLEGITATTAANNFSVLDTEVTGCAGTNAAVDVAASNLGTISGCNIHGNSKVGIYLASTGVGVRGCKVWGNTLAGIKVSAYPVQVNGCTVHGNGGDGLQMPTYHILTEIRNNIFTSNGGYGINSPITPAAADQAVDYNFYGTGSLANTSGARTTNLLAGAHDLSGDPGYANAAAGDFTPSNAALQAGSP